MQTFLKKIDRKAKKVNFNISEETESLASTNKKFAKELGFEFDEYEFMEKAYINFHKKVHKERKQKQAELAANDEDSGEKQKDDKQHQSKDSEHFDSNGKKEVDSEDKTESKTDEKKFDHKKSGIQLKNKAESKTDKKSETDKKEVDSEDKTESKTDEKKFDYKKSDIQLKNKTEPKKEVDNGYKIILQTGSNVEQKPKQS